jgi:hypothetical protein
MMSIFKKLFSCSICGFGILLVLVCILVLVSPKLINLDVVKGRILIGVSQKVGGELKYQKVDLVFFPRPHVVIHQARLSIPKNINGKLASLKAYPALLPFLKGNIHLAKLKGFEPELIISLPEKNLPSHYKQQTLSFGSIKATLSNILADTPLYTPGLVVLFKKGRLKIMHQDRIIFEFQEIDARIKYETGAAKIALNCKSNLWEHIHFRGQITSTGNITNGQVNLTHFRPHILTNYLLPAAPLQVSDSRLDLKFSLETVQEQEMFAELQGFMPYLVLQNKNETLVLQGKVFKAALHVGLNKIFLSLPELILDDPQLRLTGELLIDQKTPQIKINLRARELNVDSVRKTSLWLAGSATPVQKIFSILKSGTIPLITVNAQVRSLSELRKIENIQIGGQIYNGKIFIPRADLNVADVQGNVLIYQGILEGKDLQARLGNSTGRDGILKLGLTRKAPVFRLEIMTHTDMAQLAPVLHQLIKNEGFRKEFSRFAVFKGSAEAKLILYRKHHSINVKALVSQADLYSVNNRFSYPIKIQGGQISLKGAQLAVKIAEAAIGQSYFSRFSAEIDWQKRPRIKIITDASRIFLSEIYPWLLTLAKNDGIFERFNILGGRVSLMKLNIEGPAFNIKKWQLETSGKIEDLHIESALFSDPIFITDGYFDAQQSNFRKTTKINVLMMPTRLHWGNSNLDLEGDVSISSEGIQLNIDVAADHIGWNKVKEIVDLSNINKAYTRIKKKDFLPLQGALRIKSDHFKYGDFTWQPVYANVYFESAGTFVDVTQANICGISISGALKVSPQEIELYFYPASNNQKVGVSLSCFGGNEELVTGIFKLTGELEAKTAGKALTDSFRGNLEVIAQSGRIYRFGGLAKIFALINITEIFRGKLPDVAHQGFAYNTIEAKGNLSGGKFRLEEFHIDGASMEVAAKGDIDLITQQIDLTILVAPFKTVDLLVKHTPLLGDILGGNIISIPFRVTGGLKDPDVIPISPTAVGTGLLGITKRTLQVPVKIMQPLLDSGKKRNEFDIEANAQNSPGSF